MKWTIQQIKDYPEDIMPVDVELNLFDDIQKRQNDIIDMEPVKVQGYYAAIDNEIILHGEIDANLTLPSTRTLEPVSVNLQIPIKERYVSPDFDTDIKAYEETTIVLEHDYVDLDNAVIDSILLNLPVRVLGPDETDDKLPAGQDWVVVTEESFKQQQEKEKEDTVDPRFAKLQDLFDDDNEDNSEDL